MYRVSILSSIVLLLQSGSVHNATTTTVGRPQSSTVPSLASGYSTLTTTMATNTTTVRRTLSSIPPSLAPSYSAITTDGEWILLFRLAYRVDIRYGVSVLASIVLILQSGSVHYRVDIRYQVSVLSSIVLLLQLGLINTIAIMQLVVLYQGYQGKYKTIRPFHGEWILLFRLAYRVDRTYRVSVLSSIVLLLQSWILLFQLAYRVNRMYRAMQAVAKMSWTASCLFCLPKASPGIIILYISGN
jgi:hypothetical protein